MEDRRRRALPSCRLVCVFAAHAPFREAPMRTYLNVCQQLLSRQLLRLLRAAHLEAAAVRCSSTTLRGRLPATAAGTHAGSKQQHAGSLNMDTNQAIRRTKAVWCPWVFLQPHDKAHCAPPSVMPRVGSRC